MAKSKRARRPKHPPAIQVSSRPNNLPGFVKAVTTVIYESTRPCGGESVHRTRYLGTALSS